MAFTYFFRDLHTLELIREHALPYLRTKSFIEIWDAGCAMGQEPYSLAMILNESMSYMYFRNVKITATDIDESNLFEKIISEGVYSQEQTQRIPREIFNRHFSNYNGNCEFKLSDEIIKSVDFMKHDLLSLKPPKRGFGLILCKNVLLHFNEEQRANVIGMFAESLIDGGYLAMEQTQKMPEKCQDIFEQVVTNGQLYKKRCV